MEEQTAATDAILTRLAAALGDRYEIERPLGEGGMAFVYLARDVKHDRQVAIKVLKPELAASLGAERFLREIQLTAKLQHPHILPLYDSGAADGLLYYVMPFVMGESLNDYLAREKQLSISEAIQIAREVAEALGQAHTMGLVHRDIKPDNVMMSGGHAIVADFGIARAVTEAGGEKLTKTGMAVGTPAYMSPEQIGGDETVDGRSDLYSLGCMLYEMLVGQIPFTGPTAMAIMARHTMDQITPPSIMRQSVPPEVEDIVFKAMEKTPADRYRTALEMIEALKAIERGEVSTPRVSMAVRGSRAMRGSQMTGRMTGVQEMVPARRWPLVAGIAGGVVVVGAVAAWLVAGRGGGGAPVATGGLNPRHIAVLYFDDLSRDGQLGHVADGLTEGLIDKLATVEGLSVVSRNGVEAFRGTTVARDSIARALDAGSLVVGSVEPVGDQLEVVARLVEGSSGTDIERASFRLPAGELLVALDSVTGAVSNFLRQRLGEEVRTIARRSSTTNVEAWALVQRAERARKEAIALRGQDPDAASQRFHQGDSLLSLAERADPKWPEPIIQRGWIAYYGASLAEEQREVIDAIQESVTDAGRALTLDPQAAEALHLRGRARYRLWLMRASANAEEQGKLLDSAQADLEKATELDPTLANAWYALSVLSYDKNDNFAAVRAAERSYEADAFLASQNNSVYQLFQTYYDLEQFPNAQRWCDEGARRFPTEERFASCQLMMLITPWAKPDVGRAWALSRAVDTLATDSLSPRVGRMWVAGVLAREGLADSARAVLQAARASQEIDPTRLLAAREAVIRVLLGDQDQAVDLLNQYTLANPTHSFDLRSGDLHWWWRPLRDNARFKARAADSH